MNIQKIPLIIFCLAVMALSCGACSTQATVSTPWPTEPTIPAVPTPAPIYPLVEQSTLTAGDLVLKPTRVVSPWQYEYSMGAGWLVIEKNLIRGVDADGKEEWSTTSPDGSALRWLAASDHISYLTIDNDPSMGQAASRVFRLDADARQWLPPLNLPPADLPEQGFESITAALADDPFLFVLSLVGKADGVLAYRVTCYNQDDLEPVWSRTFEWAGERGGPGVLLWAAHTPEYTIPSPVPLTRMNDSLIVCAGERQDILSLDRATGKDRWKVERIWEYERGFIGPSVWSYYISRFGQDWSWQDDENAFAEAREQFDERLCDCRRSCHRAVFSTEQVRLSWI